MRPDEVYAILKGKIVKLSEKVENIPIPLTYKGSVDTVENLPANPQIGWMYNISQKSIYGEAGMNVAWTGTEWDPLGSAVDMSLYMTKEDGAKKLDKNQGAENSGMITGINEDGEIVPVFPVGIEYNDEEKRLEFGADEKLNLNAGIQLDNTLTKSGYAADAAETGKAVDELRTGVKDLSDKKITKFYASNLGETTLNDSDNGKIQDMKLYGKSFQQTYSGKNLLKRTLETITKSGVTCTNNGDGTFTVNGTATAKVTFYVVDSNGININVDNDFRIIGCPTGGGADSYSLTLFDNINGKWHDEYGNGKNITNTNKITVYIQIQNGVTVNNLVFKPMLTTDLTATYDDYEPYVGGIPSPNPDYPQEIQSVVNPVVKVCGKNLLKPTLETTTVNGVTITNNGDGTYTLNGTATDRVVLFLFDNKIMPLYKGDYSIIITDKNESIINQIAVLFTNDGWKTITKNDYNFTFTIGENDTIEQIWADILSGTVVDNVVIKPMLTTDLNATYYDFEPYKEQTATLPYTLNATLISSGGNVTIDGQQYVADYVDIENKQLHRLVDSSKLDPTVSIVDNTDLLLSLEEVIDLTDEEVQAFKELATYYPTTNVFVTSDQLDGYTEFNYPLSMENGWNLIKEQLGDTRDYIYDAEVKLLETSIDTAILTAMMEG